MRKVFMAIALAGALALGSVQALADSDSTLTKAGETALQSLKQARADCFGTLKATFDSAAVPDSKEAAAEGFLRTAQSKIDVIALSAITGLKAALEAVEDEDDTSPTQGQLDALTMAIEKANTATAAINAPTGCAAANKTLHDALMGLVVTPPVNDEDANEVESDNDSQSDTAKTVKHEKGDHEKGDHEKKQDRESDSERD